MTLAPVGPRLPRALADGLAALRRELAAPVPAYAGVAPMVPRPRAAGTPGVLRPAGAAGASVPVPARPVDPEPVEDEPELPVAGSDTATALALLERAQQGDAEAFGALYDRYVGLVYRYVYYRVGSAALAEDLTSECFLRALRRITSFSWQGRDPGAWFVTIARNLIADHYKSGRYRLELTTDDVTESAPPQFTESPEAEVLEGITNRLLLEAVKQLNPEQQECIVLRFLQGLSVSETAAVMGKNDGAIKALQYRAVRSLGRLLPEGVGL